MDCVKSIRHLLGNHYENEHFVIDKTGVKMIEILAANFHADEEAIFGTINHDYAEREKEWYLSMNRNVRAFPGGAPTIWKEVSDHNGYINSNYGWCCFSSQNGHQYHNMLKELLHNPYSRRATIIYTRPEMWEEFNLNGRSDFICTNTVQYFIREGHVYASVQMRSQDVVMGYKNDRHWQNFMLDRLLQDLHVQWPELKKGEIYWSVGSLHVYERHFYLVDYYNIHGVHNITKKVYDDFIVGGHLSV